jgi:hypothetical protein
MASPLKKPKTDELRPEYRREDLSPGVRGKHFKDYMAGTNLVLLKPDVAAAFPTAKAVDAALRSLMPPTRRTARAAQTSPRRARNTRK